MTKHRIHRRLRAFTTKRGRKLVRVIESNAHGYCSHEERNVDCHIHISARGGQRKRLETFVHECLHGLDRKLPEPFVKNAGEFIALVLWQFGWRRK